MRERRLCEGGCGRWLTSEESLALRFGRRCAERLGIPIAPPARRLAAATRRPQPARPADRPVDVGDGQTALDLQPDLWTP